MKKKNKFLLGAAFACGVVASFGSAYALYLNNSSAGDISIGIGSVATHTDSTTDTLTYSIGDVVAYKDSVADGNAIELSTAKLSPSLNKVVLKAPLSFSYSYSANVKSASAQDYAVARVSVNVTIDKTLAAIKTEKDNADTVKVSAQLAGYQKASVTNNGTTTLEDTYFTTNKVADFISSTTSADDSGNTVYSGTLDTAIDASSIYCLITIDMSSTITAANFLSLAEITSAFKVTLDLGSFDTSATDANLTPSAYIRGDRSDWKSFTDYRMVPNVNHAGNEVEWTYKLLNGFSMIKVYDENNTSGAWVSCRGTNATGCTAQSDGNASLKNNRSYDVYYTRNAASNPGFYVTGGNLVEGES